MTHAFSFGGNRFSGGTVVPVAIGDRYVVVEPSDADSPLVSVVRDVDGNAVFEVFRNEPGEGSGFSAEKAQNGFVIVGETEDDFEYKVRPDSETTLIFGTLRGDEIEVKITDRAIHVGGNTFERNALVGVAGVVVKRDGEIGFGGRALPSSLIDLLQPPTS